MHAGAERSQQLSFYTIEVQLCISKTSELQHHNVEIYANAVIAFTHLYAYDLDL